MCIDPPNSLHAQPPYLESKPGKNPGNRARRPLPILDAQLPRPGYCRERVFSRVWGRCCDGAAGGRVVWL